MRQSQQNRRSRGRNNNNRKGQNPLTRSYESNGPDVKIRGTPSHIAEKYVAMARDALSNGDPVLAENYLQHAEHYNRIIMTYREQQVPQHNDQAHQGSNGRGRHGAESSEEDGSIDEQPASRADTPPPGSEPQPTLDSVSDEQAEDRPRRRSSSRERSSSGDGERTERTSNGRSRGRRSRYAEPEDQQPDFLKRPVRRRASSAETDEVASEPVSVQSDEAAE